VNALGELVAGMDTVELGEERREEFTLAMDLPLMLPKPKVKSIYMDYMVWPIPMI